MVRTLLLLLATLGFRNLVTAQDGIPDGQGLNWYEALPAVAMDYKVHIDAGKPKFIETGLSRWFSIFFTT